MNLLSLLKYQLGPTIAEQMGHFLGEDPKKTKTAIDATFPTLLSVFVKKASKQTGANDLMDIIKHGNHNGDSINYISGLFRGNSSMNSILSSGNVLANKFLGNKKGVLVSSIANYSGLSSSSTDTLIRVSIPLVLGMVGKQVKNQKLDVQELMTLLSSQKGHIGAALPSGFIIGGGSPSNISTPKTQTINTINQVGVKKSTVVPPKREYKQVVNTPPKTPQSNIQKPVTPTPPISTPKTPPAPKPLYKAPKGAKVTSTPPVQNKIIQNPPIVNAPNSIGTVTPIQEKTTSLKRKSPIKKILPILLVGLALVVTLSFLGLRGCISKEGTIKKDNEQANVITPTSTNDDTKTTTDQPVVDAGSETDTEVVTDTGGEEMTGSDDSYENDNNDSNNNYNENVAPVSSGAVKAQLTSAINNGTGGVITLDDLRFRGAIIRGQSRIVVREIAEVMRTNPNMRIRLESIPVTRAISLKKGLMDAGIDRNRIDHVEGGSSTVQLYMN